MRLFEHIRQFFVVEDEEETLRPEEQDGQAPPVKQRRRGTLVSLSNPRRLDLVLLEPVTLAEAQEVGERLRNRCAVIVNLQHTERDIALRIIDFTSGITCALNGTAHKITEWVFVFAPPNVEVMAPPKRQPRDRDQKEQLYFVSPEPDHSERGGRPEGRAGCRDHGGSGIPSR